MTAGDALLEAIHADPDDDAARLVYADWLGDRGDPLGEFIHVELAIAKLPPFHPDRVALVQRRLDIFDAHLRAWWLAWWRWEPMFPRFHRGLLESVHFHATQDVATFDTRLAQLVEHWLDYDCACGHVHHPLLRAAPDGRFPLVRRFGGLQLDRMWQLAPELRLRDAVEARVEGYGQFDAEKAWMALATVRTLRVLLTFACTDVRGFDHVLALPELAHLAIERSPPLVAHLAVYGVPESVRSISLEPTAAAPLREGLARAGRAFVENTQPTGDELVLITDARRAPDLAFVEYPIVVAPSSRKHGVTSRDQQRIEQVSRPGASMRYGDTEWRRVDQLSFGSGPQCTAHGLAVPDRAGGARIHVQRSYASSTVLVDTGLRVDSIGPVYFRVGNLMPGRSLLVVWRCDCNEPEVAMHVVIGGEPIRCDRPAAGGGWRNWVFVIGAEDVRETTLQLVIDGERDRPFTLYSVWFYQPLR